MSQTILVVNDEALIVDLLFIKLTKMGYGVKTANSSESALHILKFGAPAAIVTDIRRPPGSMDGLEMVLKIRQDHPSIPVFFFAGGVDVYELETLKQVSEGVFPNTDIAKLLSALERVVPISSPT